MQAVAPQPQQHGQLIWGAVGLVGGMLLGGAALHFSGAWAHFHREHED